LSHRAPRRAGTCSLERVPPRTRRPSHRLESFVLDQRKLDRAKSALGVATDTEAISSALDAVVDLAGFRVEIEHGLRRLVGRGGFDDRF